MARQVRGAHLWLASSIRRLYIWTRLHRITGVEVGQAALLVIAALVLLSIPRPLRGAFADMDAVGRLEFWAMVLVVDIVVMLLTAYCHHRRLHQVTLTVAAAWWFSIGALLLVNGSTFLTSSLYGAVGIGAIWRVGDLAVRERAA